MPTNELPDFEVEGDSPSFELDTTPLWREILAIAKLRSTTEAFEREFRDSINRLTVRLGASLRDYKAGFLVRVNIEQNEAGETIIRGGELLTPIGLGLEPIDSLAEFYRSQPAPAPSRRDLSFFFWLTR